MKKQKIPLLTYEDWMDDNHKKLLDQAYEKVKTIRNADKDGNLDFYSLINYAFEQEKELEIKKFEMIKEIIHDKDKMNSKWLNENPKILSLIKEYDPDILLKIEAIEISSEVVVAQNKYNNRKYIYLIFGSLLGVAIYKFWGGVIGFLIGYGIRYYFQPKKVVDRLLSKKSK